MRSCEFSAETSIGKIDCRAHDVQAFVADGWVSITRGEQLARLERTYGTLRMTIDGESAESAERQESSHRRERHPELSMFLEGTSARAIANSAPTQSAREVSRLFEQSAELLKTRDWAGAERVFEQTRAAWVRCCAEASQLLPRPDTPFSNMLRSNGVAERDVSTLGYASCDWVAGKDAQRVGAKAAAELLKAGTDIADVHAAAMWVSFLYGAEKPWGSETRAREVLGMTQQVLSGVGVIPSGLILLAGPAGSGKSTHALRLAQSSTVQVRVVSTDGIRLELLGDEASQERGDEVFKERDRRVQEALRQGEAVVVDATNLDRSAERLINFAKRNGSVVTVVRLDTPAERIFAQNASRDRVVPEEAVARHVQRHDMLDEAGWQKRGADLVLSVSEAEYVAECPEHGWNTRIRGAEDVQRLVQLGVATPDHAGEVRFPSARVSVDGGRFSRQDAIFPAQ